MTEKIFQKSNYRNLLLMFLLFLTSANANVFSTDYFIIFYTILLVVIVLKSGRNYALRSIILACVVIVIYTFGYLLKFGLIDFGFIVRFSGYAIIGLVTVTLIGKKAFFYKYVDVIYVLALISLVFFTIQLIIPSILLAILTLVDKALHISLRENTFSYANIIIYTIVERGSEVRNYGFAFEPGFFAGFLSLGLFFSLFKLNGGFDFKSKVILLTIITTQSTTGIFASLGIILFYLIGIKKNYALFFLTIPLFIYIFFQLDILADKIFGLWENSLTMDSHIQLGSTFSGGRFFGLKLAMIDFVNNPIIGYGDYNKVSYSKAILLSDIGQISGIGNYLAQLGSVGLIILIVCFNRSLKEMKLLFQPKIFFTVFIFVLLVFSFAFTITLTPLFFSFMLYSWADNPIQSSFIKLN